MSDIRDSEIVIVGGGIVGCSIAYHLAKLGKRDVLLLEKSGLTHGSTWHAVGMVGQLRAHRNYTRMNSYSVELYSRIEEETGLSADWRQGGSLRLASSAARWDEIRRQATLARGFGLEVHLLGPREVMDRLPMVDGTGVVGAAFMPTDGSADPSGLTLAIAKGARQRGVRIAEGVRVTGFDIAGRRIRRVVTGHGAIRADLVVNAAGIWAGAIGRLMGVAIPAGAIHHQYLVTEPIARLAGDFANFRDPDNLFYCKPELNGRLTVGGFEPNNSWFDPPADFARELFAPDIERAEPITSRAMRRVPALADVGVQAWINGPIPMSADGVPVIGRAPELDNVFVACGFTAGIASGGGAGRVVAEWIAGGEPSFDVWPLDIRRFGPVHGTEAFLRRRSLEVNDRYYPLQKYGVEMTSARPARQSPLYPYLAAKGAVFGSKFGWERVNWFDPDRPRNGADLGFNDPETLAAVGREHRAIRAGVGLIDMTSFTKLEIEGPGALQALQRIAANDLDRPVGTLIYTQLCNERGGIEADLTFARVAEDRFYVVTGTGFTLRDHGHIRARLPADGSVALRDVTSAYAVLNLCGPKSRAVLQAVAEEDVGDAAFPYMTGRRLRLGMTTALALRVTFLGELGYELHVPVEGAARLYELLCEAGAIHGLVNAGYRVIESLRLEKANRVWGVDVTPDTDPYEAGLGFCVRLNKGDFIGRDALLRLKQQGPRRRFVSLALDGQHDLRGGEVIYGDGNLIGQTTSGGYGFTVEQTIALGYVPAGEPARAYEIELLGDRLPARRHDRPLFDPDGRRVRL